MREEGSAAMLRHSAFCMGETQGFDGGRGVKTGDKIRALRKEKGFTLDKLAELSGSSKSYIWELENKNPPRPSGEKVSKIAAALGVTADYLLDLEDGVENSKDECFYKKYKQMNIKTKEKLHKIMDLLCDA